MENKIARKPNNILWGVGEHTTLLQNRVLTTALSYFNSQMSVEEIRKLSSEQLKEIVVKRSTETIDIPLDSFMMDYSINETHSQERFVKQVKRLSKIGYSYETDTSISFSNIFQHTQYKYRDTHISIRFTPVFIEDLLTMVLQGYTPIKLKYYLSLTKEYSSRLYFSSNLKSNFSTKLYQS